MDALVVEKDHCNKGSVCVPPSNPFGRISEPLLFSPLGHHGRPGELQVEAVEPPETWVVGDDVGQCSYL